MPLMHITLLVPHITSYAILQIDHLPVEQEEWGPTEGYRGLSDSPWEASVSMTIKRASVSQCTNKILLENLSKRV